MAVVAMRLCLAVVCTLWAATVRAECDLTYRVKPGDTLSGLATQHYGAGGQWTLIHHANPDNAAVQNGRLVAGRDIYIPCPEGKEASRGADGLPGDASLTLVTGGGIAPLVDPDWPEDGVMTELVTAALEMSPVAVPFQIRQEPDRARHLEPLLTQKTYDMGFAWVKPDCAATPEADLCTGFHFSDPVMELPMMLFRLTDSGLVFESDEDLLGKRLCRPAGRAIHDLDRPGRNWVSGGRIVLLRPDSAEACCAALVADEVDAVRLNAFEGASKLVAMGLRGEVVPVERPLSRETLHVIISRTHWRGTAHLYRFNAGLAALRESGRYTEILRRHMTFFRAALQ